MPAGRPKFEIDYEKVERLASIMCTHEEIASVLGCSVDTLTRDEHFADYFKKGQENGRASLRRRQFEHAEKNPVMAIFLGKNYLGQTDRQEINATADISQKVSLEGFSTEQIKEILSKDEQK